MKIKQVFVDTDICLDLLSMREPFGIASRTLFSLADKEELIIAVSSLSFSNLNYILHSQYHSVADPRKTLAQFRTLVKILPVDDKVIDLSLASEFSDFEDAIQYYTAVESGIKTLLTRNLKDYRKAKIDVMTAEEFLTIFSQ